MDFCAKNLYDCIMSIFISHESALEYWRRHFDKPITSASLKKAVLPKSPPEKGMLQTEIVGSLSQPLHIVLSNPSARRASRPMRQHVFRAETPIGCFVSVREGLMVSSPEFCFLQMAEELSLVKLIELGYELCGTYSMPTDAISTTATAAVPPEEPRLPIKEDRPAIRQKHDVGPNEESPASKRGFNTRPALTSKRKLETFLARMLGIKGHQKAARALRYIADGAASPMEAKLAILLTLPYKLGGYHFPTPEHNGRIAPGKTAKQIASKTYYACDLFWHDYALAVEYDSDQHHTGADRIASDSKKRNALSMMGVTVVTVTNQQLHSVLELEKVACVLANHMGRRRRWLDSPGFAAAHRELRRLLL